MPEDHYWPEGGERYPSLTLHATPRRYRGNSSTFLDNIVIEVPVYRHDRQYLRRIYKIHRKSSGLSASSARLQTIGDFILALTFYRQSVVIRREDHKKGTEG